MTVAEYFAGVPTKRREVVLKLREMILREYPGIEETMDYKMPTYVWEGESLLAMANHTRYISLYVIPFHQLDPYREALQTFDVGKSCIRFSKIDVAGLETLQRVISAVGEGL
jgi:uncharacterized protein YdhG (YjbR/CyaY superfamily)